ncbi:MAG: hypothetical protein ACYTAN_05225 [Planctomycetota bacterium]
MSERSAAERDFAARLHSAAVLCALAMAVGFATAPVAATAAEEQAGRVLYANPDTLADTLMHEVSAGDVVLLEDGDYVGECLISLTGKRDAPITIAAKGGGAANCTNVANSLFINNLFYDNLAAVLVFYEDEFVGEQYESRRNYVFGNTVYFPPQTGRWSFKLRDTCRHFQVYNNLFFGGRFGAVSVSQESLEGLRMDFNGIGAHPGETVLGESYETKGEDSFVYSADQWRSMRLDRHSRFLEKAPFISPSEGDFRPLPGSDVIGAGTNLGPLFSEGIRGARRPRGRLPDCGCYEHSHLDERK